MEKVNFKTIKIIDYSIEHISYSYKTKVKITKRKIPVNQQSIL